MRCHDRKGFPWHLLCVGLAAAVVALVWMYGRGGGLSWPYALLILCPIIHVGMMIAGARWISSQPRGSGRDQTAAPDEG